MNKEFNELIKTKALNDFLVYGTNLDLKSFKYDLEKQFSQVVHSTKLKDRLKTNMQNYEEERANVSNVLRNDNKKLKIAQWVFFCTSFIGLILVIVYYGLVLSNFITVPWWVNFIVSFCLYIPVLFTVACLVLIKIRKPGIKTSQLSIVTTTQLIHCVCLLVFNALLQTGSDQKIYIVLTTISTVFFFTIPLIYSGITGWVDSYQSKKRSNDLFLLLIIANNKNNPSKSFSLTTAPLINKYFVDRLEILNFYKKTRKAPGFDKEIDQIKHLQELIHKK